MHSGKFQEEANTSPNVWGWDHILRCKYIAICPGGGYHKNYHGLYYYVKHKESMG